MPIYEYRCTKCGRTLEAIQKVDDKPLTKCTECSGRLEKLISRAAFHLKGGGWFSEGYGKDSGSSGKKGAADSSGASGETKDGSGGGKKAAAGGCGSGACGCH